MNAHLHLSGGVSVHIQGEGGVTEDVRSSRRSQALENMRTEHQTRMHETEVRLALDGDGPHVGQPVRQAATDLGQDLVPLASLEDERPLRISVE
jgi:hypothetical protein